MTLRRTFLTGLPLLAAGVASATAADEIKPPAALKTIADIEKQLSATYDPPAGLGHGKPEWKEATFRGSKLLFCLIVLPSFGESYMDVLGWVWREAFQEWRPLLNVKTRNLGDAVWNIDSTTGIFSLKGDANNELKGVEVVRFDLRAVLPSFSNGRNAQPQLE